MMFSFVFFSLIAWLPLGYEDRVDSIQCEQHELTTIFDTNVHVEAKAVYPSFAEGSSLCRYANESLKNDATHRFDSYVQRLRCFQEDVDEDDLDRDYLFRYFPIYYSSNLISVYGYEYQYWSLPHGWFHHVAKTFWTRPDGSVKELDFTDMFIGDAVRFILNYSNYYFKSHRYGYYSYEEEYWPDPLNKRDLESFVLSERGLLLIFPMYRVWGFGDGPDTLLIPYADLKPIINPNGPIPALMKADPAKIATENNGNPTELQVNEV